MLFSQTHCLYATVQMSVVFCRMQACFSRAPESHPLSAELYKHQGQRLALFFLLFWFAVHWQTGWVSTHFLLMVNSMTSWAKTSLLFMCLTIKRHWDPIWHMEWCRIYLPSKQKVYFVSVVVCGTLECVSGRSLCPAVQLTEHMLRFGCWSPA